MSDEEGLGLKGVAGALLFVMGRMGVGCRSCELIVLALYISCGSFEDKFFKFIYIFFFGKNKKDILFFWTQRKRDMTTF